MMRRLTAAALVLAFAAACAPKAPPTLPGEPRYPDFIFPRPPSSVSSAGQAGQREAWDALQAGNLAGAERELTQLLTGTPDNPALVASLGYVALARHDFDRAVARFDSAIILQPLLASALVGRALGLAQLGRASEALASLEAAQQADPSLDLTARIDALRFRAVEDAVGNARAAANAGKLDEARRDYEVAFTASPDSALLLRELAGVERRAGLHAGARAHLEKAVEVDPTDRPTRLQLADVLEEEGDTAGAVRQFQAAQGIERSPEVEAKLASLRERVDLAALPEQFRSISAAPTVTRGDMAALLGVRLPGLLRAAPERPAALVTDVAGTWAAPWIAAVLRAGVMEAFPNHTFQPAGLARRSDLAAVISRVLSLAATLDPARARNWQHDRVSFSDLLSTHPAFDAANRAVGARVLDPGPGGAFEPTRLLSGAEASEAVARLERLIGPRARGGGK